MNMGELCAASWCEVNRQNILFSFCEESLLFEEKRVVNCGF